jgi:hypothetical protein
VGRSDNALLHTQAKLFRTERVHKGLLEIFKVWSHAKDLPILSRDGDKFGSVLSPYEVSLMGAVELWKKKRAGLLFLCIAFLLAATNTSSRTMMRLGGCGVLAIIVG